LPAAADWLPIQHAYRNHLVLEFTICLHHKASVPPDFTQNATSFQPVQAA